MSHKQSEGQNPDCDIGSHSTGGFRGGSNSIFKSRLVDNRANDASNDAPEARQDIMPVKRFFAFLALCAYLVGIPSLATGIFVLCRGSDGHLAIENASADIQGTKAHPKLQVTKLQVTRSLVPDRVAMHHAAPCDDSCASHLENSSSRDPVAVPSPRSIALPTIPSAVHSLAQVKPSSRPHLERASPSLTLVELGTVRLLI